MNALVALSALVLVAVLALALFGLALLAAILALAASGALHRADSECRSFLTTYAEEEGVTILRCSRCWMIPQIDDLTPMRVVYRLSAVDQRGRLLKGWGSVAIRLLRDEPILKGARLRWVSVREVPRPVARPARAARDRLWDPWIDG